MEEDQPELIREETVSLIAEHSAKLADLARSYRFETVHYLLHMAAQQAERELRALQSHREGG